MGPERGKRRAPCSRRASPMFAVSAAVLITGCGNSGTGQPNRTPSGSGSGPGSSGSASSSGQGSTSSGSGSSGSTGSSGSASSSGQNSTSSSGSASSSGQGSTSSGSGSGGSTGSSGSSSGGSTGSSGSSSGKGSSGSSSSGGSSGSSSSGGVAGDGSAGSSGGGGTADGGALSQAWVTIHNDFFWYDDTGTLIQVRSGALRQFNGIYYWYGSQPGGLDQTCYASTDLVHWTYKGVPLVTAQLCDRMDVLYDDTTKQYVMFLKYNGDKASFGTATASAPEGPYTFLGDTLVDGNYIGDMSMYKDDDGKAYLAYVWDEAGPNRQHAIYRMSADYLSLDTRMYLFNVPSREAPHMFKRNGTYYYGVSETNGIQPSPTRYYTATVLTGPWSAATMLVTPGSTTTYETQCDFVFPFTGTQGTVYMLDADRWIPTGGFQGDYLWLPMTFDAAGAPTMDYYQDWDLNVTSGAWRAFDRTSRDLALGKTATASSQIATNTASSVTTATTYQNYTATRWESQASDPQWIMVDLGSAMNVDRVILKWYTDYAKAFDIEVSNDSMTWTSVYSTTTGASYSVTDVTFKATSARYVRMNGTKRGNANGYSLFAFMVLDDP